MFRCAIWSSEWEQTLCEVINDKADQGSHTSPFRPSVGAWYVLSVVSSPNTNHTSHKGQKHKFLLHTSSRCAKRGSMTRLPVVNNMQISSDKGATWGMPLATHWGPVSWKQVKAAAPWLPIHTSLHCCPSRTYPSCGQYIYQSNSVTWRMKGACSAIQFCHPREHDMTVSMVILQMTSFVSHCSLRLRFPHQEELQ